MFLWRKMENYPYPYIIPYVEHCNTDFQIRGGFEDNSRIFFLISQWKHML